MNNIGMIENNLSRAEQERKEKASNTTKKLNDIRADINKIGVNITKYYHIDRKVLASTGGMLTVLTNKRNRLEQYRVNWSLNDEELPKVIKRLVEAKESGSILEGELFTEDEKLLNIAREYLVLKGVK